MTSFCHSFYHSFWHSDILSVILSFWHSLFHSVIRSVLSWFCHSFIHIFLWKRNRSKIWYGFQLNTRRGHPIACASANHRVCFWKQHNLTQKKSFTIVAFKDGRSVSAAQPYLIERCSMGILRKEMNYSLFPFIQLLPHCTQYQIVLPPISTLMMLWPYSAAWDEDKSCLFL